MSFNHSPLPSFYLTVSCLTSSSNRFVCCLDITQLHRMRSLVGCPVLYAGNNKPFLCQCTQICQMRCFVHALPCATANPYNTWICLSFPVLRIDEIQFEISPAMTEPGINLRISNVCCHNILWFPVLMFSSL